MNTRLLSFAIGLCCFWGAASAQIKLPAASPSAVVSQGIGLGEMQIEYSRPALKGRKMFGSQVPYDQVWRTGANKVTNFILSDEMEIGGRKVPAGKYALLTIPTPSEWTIILNKDADAWGSYTYKEANDVLRFKVKTEKPARTEEYFTIAVGDFSPTHAEVLIRWENTQVRFNVSQDPDARIVQEIKEKTAGSEVAVPTYLAAANYYFDTNRDLNQAFEWASKALDTSKAFWVYYLRGKIAAKIGKCDVALADAAAGLPLAKEGNDPSYVLNFEKLEKDCSKK